jgi:two-component system sensor histidine kinase KdpD
MFGVETNSKARPDAQGPRSIRRVTRGLAGYAAAVALVGLANLIAHAAGRGFGNTNLVMLFLLSVLATGTAFGLAPALLAALLAGVSYNFFYLEPRYTFLIAHPGDLFTFSAFFAVALATGWLTGRARDQAQAAAERAEAVSAMLEASRALSTTSTPDEAAQVLASQIGAATGGAAVVLLPDENGLRLVAAPAGLAELSPPHAEAAREAWQAEGAAAAPEGADAGWRFQSLEGLHGRVGVIGLRSPTRNGEAHGLLTAFLRQGAVAIERAQLASAAAENQALRDADTLRSALLSSISHDFRTPLATVLGSATTLLDYGPELEPAVRRDLLKSIREGAERLNRYVGALLDMARLEGGALKPKHDWVDVREVIGSAVRRVQPRVGERKLRRDFARTVSMVSADATLLEQAVLNLIENAVAYTPDGSTIELAVYEDPRNVVMSVEDDGPGVPLDAQAEVFDRFRRARSVSDRTGGLGLGLSITKGFVEAMGGRVAVVSPLAEGRGSRFLISLPKAAETPSGLL